MGFLVRCKSGCKVDAGLGETMVYQAFICDNEEEVIVCSICNRILYKPKVKLTEENYDEYMKF